MTPCNKEAPPPVRTLKLECNPSAIADIMQEQSAVYRGMIQATKEFVRQAELSAGGHGTKGKKLNMTALRKHLLVKGKSYNFHTLNGTMLNWTISKAQEKLEAVLDGQSICFGRRELRAYSREVNKNGKNTEAAKELKAAFRSKRTMFHAVGDSTASKHKDPYHGCRFIKIVDDTDCPHLLFKRPDTKEYVRIPLHLSKTDRRRKTLSKLKEFAANGDLALSFTIRGSCLSISYSLKAFRALETASYKVKGRVLAIDMNPNHLAYSIIDSAQGKVLLQRDFDFTEVNRQHHVRSNNFTNKMINNKRKAALSVVNDAVAFHCEAVIIEKLTIAASDKGKGKLFNRICNNQWHRSEIEHMFAKHCYLKSLPLIEVHAAYSSFMGQILNPSQLDFFAASIEIGKRGLKALRQERYMVKPRDYRPKGLPERWKYPSIPGHVVDVAQLYRWIKETAYSYRFLLSNLSSSQRVELLGSFRQFRQAKTSVHTVHHWMLPKSLTECPLVKICV